MNFIKNGSNYRSNLERRSPIRISFKKKYTFRQKLSNDKINLNSSNNRSQKYSNSKLNFLIKKSSSKLFKKEELNYKPKQSKLRILPKKNFISNKSINNQKSNENLLNKYTKNSISPSYQRFQRNKKSAYNVSIPFEKIKKNRNKLVIVSRDKKRRKLETEKMNYKSKYQLNQHTIEKEKTSSNNSNKKTIEKFLKLNQVLDQKSRSIEFKKIRKKDIQKLKRHNKNFISEDKEKSKIGQGDKNPFQIKKKQITKVKRDKQNKYYKYLQKKFQDNKLSQDLAKDIKKKFQKWNSKELAEFYNFKSNISFYRIIQQIGKGCFGKVYLAMQILTQTYVALKVIPRSSIKTKNSMKKIKKEVKILKRVNNNSSIIKLFEVFEDEKYVYMVFEYVEKGDLVKYFKVNPLLEKSQLKEFFARIIKGTHYLHKNNIIHRDIKLDNILLDKNMNPKICDFGISSEFDFRRKIYDTGGTPAYLAPEVIKAEGGVGLKSDVWSLGVLLFLLGYGVVPFQAKNMQQLYNKIIIGKFSFPDYQISQNFKNLIHKMLQVNVNKRYDLDQVIKHPWFDEIGGIKTERKMNKKLSEKEISKINAIEMFLEDLNFPKEFISQSKNNNLFNHMKACRDSLFQKFNIIHLIDKINQSKKSKSLFSYSDFSF